MFFHDKLLHLVKEGTLNPQYFASIVDRRNTHGFNQDPIYFEYNLDKRIPTDKSTVDCLRFSIGLTPLFASEKEILRMYQADCQQCLQGD